MVAEGTQLVTLGNQSEDLVGALHILAAELGTDRPISIEAVPPDQMPSPAGPLDGDAVSAILAGHLPDDAIVCYEGNVTGRRLFGYSERSAPHDFLSVTGGSLGCSLPVAIGASIACPDRKVITYVSDGSALMFHRLSGRRRGRTWIF